MTGLYIHIPFCKSKCPYCGFYSHPADEGTMRRYVDALGHEAEALREIDPQAIETIYIGGGTPSILGADNLSRILELISPHIKNATEITCEVNPDSATPDVLAALVQGGVNRLSIGVQSFIEENLKRLGRVHSVAQAVDAFNLARDAGFRNISVDLMYGLPSQTTDSWFVDLFKVVEIKPEHISFYGLTLEDSTPFEKSFREGKGLPSEEECRIMYYDGVNLFSAKGFHHYEISNFARPGFESKHNINYWKHGTYHALGASAAGFDGLRRWKNVADTGKYIEDIHTKGNAIDEEEVLTDEQLISEEMMLGLRLTDGVDLGELSRKYDVDISMLYEGIIRTLEDPGVVRYMDGILSLTDDGLFVSDAVIREFMLV